MSAAYLIASRQGIVGPYGEREILQLVTSGTVYADDKCCLEDSEDWQLLSKAVPSVWAAPNVKLRPRGPAAHAASDRRLVPAFLLWLFFGVIGVHNFYLGCIWTGVCQLVLALFAVGLYPLWAIIAILYIIDGVFVIAGGKHDGEGRKVTQWT